MLHPKGAAGLTGFVGAYTGGGAKGRGIYAFTLSPEGELRGFRLAAETPNPSYMAWGPGRRFLYAVNELEDGAGAVSAFVPGASSLRLAAARPSGAGGPCHIALAPGGGLLAVSNYTCGSLMALSAGAGGEPFGPPGTEALFPFTGSGPRPDRQEKAHAHSFCFAPVPAPAAGPPWGVCLDLGGDALHVFYLDRACPARLTPLRDIHCPAGTGPRHGVFHPTLPLLYVLGELDCALHTFRYRQESPAATLSYWASFPWLGGGVPLASGAAIRLDPGGRFLYASIRGLDLIALFTLDAAGVPAFTEAVPSGGKNPRDIALAELPGGGAFLTAANQDSDNLTVFRRDSASGRLSRLGSSPAPSPACVLFR